MSAPVIDHEPVHEIADELVDQEHVYEVRTTEDGVTYLVSTWWSEPIDKEEARRG